MKTGQTDSETRTLSCFAVYTASVPMNMNVLGSTKKVQVKSKAGTGQCVRQHYQVQEPE